MAALLYTAAIIDMENPVANTKTKHGILVTALRDCTTYDHNKYRYTCYTVIVT